MSQPAIVVMAKAPAPGAVKTRLCPPLTAAECASLAAAFARDTVRNMRIACDAVIVAFAPADGRDSLERAIAAPGIQWMPQHGCDLGERMANALADAAAAGHSPAVLVGTDIPHMPPECAAAAHQALAGGRADVALGPSEDGGFYLVGVRGSLPGLFAAVPWSTSRAYAAAVVNASALGMRVHCMPASYDVDTIGDLRRLRAEAAADAELRTRISATMLAIEQIDPQVWQDR